MICQARNKKWIETREIVKHNTQLDRELDREPPELLIEMIHHNNIMSAEYIYMNQAQLDVFIRELTFIRDKMKDFNVEQSDK